MVRVWGLVWVVIVVEQVYGVKVLDLLYIVMGNWIYNQGNYEFDEVIIQLLVDVGLFVELVKVVISDVYDNVLCKSYYVGMDVVGEDVGMLMIYVNGVVFFGLVFLKILCGEEVGKFWDVLVIFVFYLYFFEFKWICIELFQFDQLLIVNLVLEYVWVFVVEFIIGGCLCWCLVVCWV